MRRPTRTALATVAVVTAAAVAGGCGFGAGAGTSHVSLTVTRGFGASRLATVNQTRVPGSETVMRMLERSFHVQTRYGGGFVQAINGMAGDANRRDWFYYVNGVEAPQGAATTAVHKGDRIWWDLHDWTVTNSVPAVVGSFPEPFAHGFGGKRFPTTLECAPDMTNVCGQVAAGLHAVGVPVASQLLGTGSGTASLAVVVGTWSELHTLIAAQLVAKGPRRSGVYARFTPNGTTLELLNPEGRVARTIGAGSGLVAATRDNVSAPTWMITGTDRRGVSAAAAALTAARLEDRFALAVSPTGGDVSLPVEGGR